MMVKVLCGVVVVLCIVCIGLLCGFVVEFFVENCCDVVV